ncbi:unnamed protein product [Bursaphelenchus okinawaensis]|uniref:Exocyst component Exo84 C-terminal domain-containing protein n=1 Tax=Bursaphelenchus okinawaensis TaxID=465554 RepID=A0A811JS18_9BILA|nr:unnamed protein product [Bursaphelenchus okinawaensis]CAG9080366.1 unnamed protein product [Bursaphelenchus okinawaensis]
MSVNESFEGEQLVTEEFNGAQYVNDILNNSRPGEEVNKLHVLKSKLTAESNTASEQIKDIIFDHYRQFIDTSKEVSSLEKEIYELSTLLTDQKALIENLMDLCGQEKGSVCSVSLHSAGNNQSNSLQTLMHKVEGIADELNRLKPTEKILLQSEFTLLSENTMEPVHSVFLVLLTETFFICNPSNNPKMKFTFVSAHRLDSVAIVNVKRAATENPFAELIMQLMIFPEQLYLKCDAPRVKKQWLEGIENAKRSLEKEKNLHRQATIRAKRRKSSAATHPADPRDRLATIKSQNSEAIQEDDQEKLEADMEWLRGLENDLQEEISHRRLDMAVELLMETKTAKCTDPELKARIGAYEKQIIKTLSDEIKRPGALHGGAKALHRPLTLLKSLGRSTYAIDLYLKRRSSALSQRAREFTISEEPLSYVRHVSTVFISAILEVITEFKKEKEDYCLVVQWACSELSLLLSLIRRHVLEVAPTMAVLTNAWRILAGELEILRYEGLDLSFEVNRLLAPSLRTALESNFTNIIESTRLRIQEERWQPYNLETESSLNRYLEEMSDLGLCIDWAIMPHQPHSLSISQSGCEFARVARSLSRDLSLLKSSGHLRELSIDFIRTVWSDYCELLAQPINTDVHTFTCKFIVNQLIPLCEEIYREDLIRLLLQKRFPSLLQFVDRPLQRVEDDQEEEDV